MGTALKQRALPGQDGGHPQCQCQLGCFGRLERDAAQVNPVLVAVHFRADQLHQAQDQQGPAQYRPGEAFEPHHVDARKDKHGEDANDREHALLKCITIGRLSGGNGFDAGGREHHHDANGGQGERGTQDEVVG